jgi:hypothetical protein
MNRFLPTWLFVALMCAPLGLIILSEYGSTHNAPCSSELTSNADVPVWIGSTSRAARGTRWVGTSLPSPALYLIGAGERVPLPSSYTTLTLLGSGSPSFGEPSFNKPYKPVAV